MKMLMAAVSIAFLIALFGCATGTSIVTGKVRPAKNPSEVKLYLEPPTKYETIGIVEASSDVEFSSQAALDRAIQELKAQAAKIGANGVLISNTGDKSSNFGFYSGGVFYAGTSEAKTARGIAIFVIQERNIEEQKLTPQEQQNMQVAGLLTATTKKYTAKEITAKDLARELTKYMTDDVVYWSNYTPSWKPLRPLFSERHGIKEIIERYDYEDKHEEIKGGSGVPFDFSINGDVMYYSQHEVASFFNKKDVTWDMVTKIQFRDGKIARIEMFLDSTPIEKIYGPD